MGFFKKVSNKILTISAIMMGLLIVFSSNKIYAEEDSCDDGVRIVFQDNSPLLVTTAGSGWIDGGFVNECNLANVVNVDSVKINGVSSPVFSDITSFKNYISSRVISSIGYHKIEYTLSISSFPGQTFPMTRLVRVLGANLSANNTNIGNSTLVWGGELANQGTLGDDIIKDSVIVDDDLGTYRNSVIVVGISNNKGYIAKLDYYGNIIRYSNEVMMPDAFYTSINSISRIPNTNRYVIVGDYKMSNDGVLIPFIGEIRDSFAGTYSEESGNLFIDEFLPILKLSDLNSDKYTGGSLSSVLAIENDEIYVSGHLVGNYNKDAFLAKLVSDGQDTFSLIFSQVNSSLIGVKKDEKMNYYFSSGDEDVSNTVSPLHKVFEKADGVGEQKAQDVNYYFYNSQNNYYYLDTSESQIVEDSHYIEVEISAQIGKRMKQELDYFLENEDGNYLIDQGSFILEENYLASFKVVSGSGDEEFKKIVSTSIGNYALVGYTSSNDRVFSSLGAKNGGTAGILATFNDLWFDNNTTRPQSYSLFLDSYGINNGYETVFEDVLFDENKYVIVGSTTYDDSINFKNKGLKDGLMLIVNADFKINKMYTYGTGDNDSLYSVDLNRNKNEIKIDVDRYIAGGHNSINGYLVEFNDKTIISSRNITRIGIEGYNTIYDVKVFKVENDPLLNINNFYNYIVFGTASNLNSIEGIGITNNGGQNFLHFLYENGEFDSFRQLAIEVNFGFVERENLTLEEAIILLGEGFSNSLKLYYDGVRYELDQQYLNEIDFWSIDEENEYLLAYQFINKRGITYYIPRSFLIIAIRETPQITGVNDLGIIKYYTYERIGTTNYDGSFVGRKYDKVAYDYVKAFYYEQNNQQITNIQMNGRVIGETLYYKNQSGSYEQVIDTGRLLQIEYFVHSEEIETDICFTIDYFGDYVEDTCEKEEIIIEGEGEEEDTIIPITKYYLRIDSYKTFRYGNSKTILVYNISQSYYKVFAKRPTFEQVSDGLEKSNFLTMYKLDHNNQMVVDNEDSLITKNNYIMLSQYLNDDQYPYSQTRKSAAFQTIEKAKQYALSQELLRVKKYFKNEATSFTDGININNLKVYYYNDGIQQSKISGQEVFYVYYIDYGNPYASNRNLCGNGKEKDALNNVISCSNYGGYAFYNMAEIEKVAKQIIEGRFINYTSENELGKFINHYDDLYLLNNPITRPYNPVYQEELFTVGYYKNLTINVDSNRVLNVWKGKAISQIYNQNLTKLPDTEVSSGVAATFGDLQMFSEEGYYTVQFCYKPDNCGDMKTFVIDYSGPLINYKFANSSKEFTFENFRPLDMSIEPIKMDLSIVDVLDLDSYSYMIGEDTIYYTKCNEISKPCLDEIDEFVYNSYIYTKEYTVYEMSFSDRIGNTSLIRFIIGTEAPSISVVEDMNEFTVEFDLFEKNVASSIGAYFIPYGYSEKDYSSENKNAYLDEISLILTNLKNEYYASLEVTENPNGEPIDVPVEEPIDENGSTTEGKISLKFTLNELVEGSSFIAQRGIYTFKIFDYFGNEFTKKIGLGVVDAELDFYIENINGGTESALFDYYNYNLVDESLVGELKDPNTKYYIDVDGQYVEETIEEYIIAEHYVKEKSSEITPYYEPIMLDAAPIFSKDGLNLGSDLINTNYQEVPYTIIKNDTFVRFISSNDIYTTVESGLRDDYGFFYYENEYSCLFKIVGEDYSIEEENETCNPEWIFKFIRAGFTNADDIRNQYKGTNIRNTYLIIDNGGTTKTIEGLGAEETNGTLDFQNKLAQLGIEFLLINEEDTKAIEGSPTVEKSDFFYLKFNDEYSYKITTESERNTVTPISKVLWIDKKEPFIKQEFEKPVEYVGVAESEIGKIMDPRVEYYIKNFEDEFVLDPSQFVNSNHYIKTYTKEGLIIDAQKEIGVDYYYKLSDDLFVIENRLPTITSHHFIIKYEKACTEDCGLYFKDPNKSYYFKNLDNGEYYLDEGAQINSNHYIQQRLLKDALIYNWSYNNKSIIVTVDNSQYVLSQEDIANNITSVTIDSSGEHTFTFADLAGNSVTLTDEIDISKPSISILSVNGEQNFNFDSYNKSYVVEIKVQESNIKQLIYYYQSSSKLPSNFEYASGVINNPSYEPIEGEENAYKFTIDFIALNDKFSGVVDFTVLVSDMSGSDESFGATLRYDNTAPTIYFDPSYNIPNDFGNHLTPQQLNSLVTLQAASIDNSYQSLLCNPSSPTQNNLDSVLYKIICLDLPSNEPITIDTYEAKRVIGNDTYLKIGLKYVLQQPGSTYYLNGNYYKFVKDVSLSTVVTNLHYIKIDDYYEKAVPGTLKKADTDYFFIQKTEGEYSKAKILNSNYLMNKIDSSQFNSSETYYYSYGASPYFEFRPLENIDAQYCDLNDCYLPESLNGDDSVGQEKSNEENYYIRTTKKIADKYVDVFIKDTRKYEMSDAKFDFSRTSTFGRPIIISAQDVIGNKIDYYLDTIIRIIDTKAPIANITSNQNSKKIYDSTTGALLGIMTNGIAELIFDEAIYKYYCQVYTSDNKFTYCSEDQYLSVPNQLIGQPKGNTSYYFYNPNTKKFEIDDGNIVLPIHYMLDNGQFVKVNELLVGSSKIEGISYYVFNEKPEDTFYYKELNESYTLMSEVVNYENCLAVGGCYTLSYELATDYTQVGPYYDLNNGNFVVIEEEITQELCDLLEGCYVITNSVKEEMVLAEGARILSVHMTKDNYNEYDYNEFMSLFDFSYDGSDYVKYVIYGEDFSGNISPTYRIFIDKQAPTMDKGGQDVVIIEAYSGTEYLDTNQTSGRALSDNLQKNAGAENINATVELIVEYKKYNVADQRIFNMSLLLGSKSFHEYWSNSSSYLQHWSNLASNEDIYQDNQIGIYIVLYRVVDATGNVSEYKEKNSRLVFIYDTIKPNINVFKNRVTNTGTVLEPVYVRTQEGANCVSGCYFSILPPVGTPNTIFEIVVTFDQHGSNESGAITFKNIKTNINNKIDGYNYILTSADSSANGQYNIEVSDIGSYIRQGKYVGASKGSTLLLTGRIAYQVVVCREDNLNCNSTSTITINSKVRNVVEFAYGSIKDYNLYDYFVIIDEYIDGALQIGKTVIYSDNGTIILPGHYLVNGLSGVEVQIDLIGKNRDPKTKYYFKINDEYIIDESSTFMLVANSSNMVFNIDNTRPVINFDKAQDSQKPFYMVVSVDDIEAELFYKIDNGQLLKITVNDQNTEFIKIFDNGTSYDVTFYKDGSYAVYASDKSGNISCFKNCSSPTNIGEALFVIDNTAPMTNANYVYKNATGVNFWYAVPKDAYESSQSMQMIYRVSPDYSSDYHSLSSTGAKNSLNLTIDFNNDGYYAFANYYDALNYLINTIAPRYSPSANNIQLYVQYVPGGSSTNSKKGLTTLTTNENKTAYEQMMDQLKYWIFPVFSEEKLFTDETVFHEAFPSPTNYLYEYVTCNISVCLGKKIPAILTTNRAVTLTIPDVNTSVTYYNIIKGGYGNINYLSPRVDLEDGVYIFKESDRATKFDGVTPAYNEVWYAYIIKNTLDTTYSSSISFISQSSVWVEDIGQYILPEHYLRSYSFASRVGDPSGLYMQTISNGRINFITYNKNIVSQLNYVRRYVKVDDGESVDGNTIYHRPIYSVDSSAGTTLNNFIYQDGVYTKVFDGENRIEGTTYYLISGYEIDPMTNKTTTFDNFVLTSHYQDTNLIGKNRSINYLYYFLINNQFVQDSGTWIDNFFYSATYSKVLDTDVGKLKQTGITYFYRVLELGSFKYYEDGLNGNYIVSSLHHLKSGSIYTPVESGLVKTIKNVSTKYYLNIIKYDEVKYTHGVGTSIVTILENEVAYLTLPTSLINRFVINGSTGEVEIQSYLKVKIRKADSIDHRTGEPLYIGGYNYVLSSKLFAVKDYIVISKPYLLETGYYYEITIQDRIGNQIIFEVSLSNVLPSISANDISYGYQKLLKVSNSKLTSTSKIEIQISTQKDVNGNIINYSGSLQMISNIISNLNSSLQNGVKSAIITGTDSKGYYRIRIEDNHGNKSNDWYYFAFNPAIIEGMFIVDSTSSDNPFNEARITNKNVQVRWNNIENSIVIYKNGLVFCQTERPNAADYCGAYMSFESQDLYRLDGFQIDTRGGFPYDAFTYNNYINCDLSNNSGCQKVADGIARVDGQVYYTEKYTKSNDKRVTNDDYIVKSIYQVLNLTDLQWEDYLEQGLDQYYISVNGSYILYEIGSNEQYDNILNYPRYIKVDNYEKPNNDEFAKLFTYARITLDTTGTYSAKICNRFDTKRCVSRLFVGEENSNYYSADDGKFILGEHYTKNSNGEYIPVSLENEVGKLKAQGVEYYFAIEINGTIIDYILDDGNYVSKSHYLLSGGAGSFQYSPILDSTIGNSRIPQTYYIKQSITSIQIDKMAPQGYENGVYIIYDGNKPSDPKYQVSFSLNQDLGYLANKITNTIGAKVVGVINNNIRVVWAENQNVKKLKYTCTYVGTTNECLGKTVEGFASYVDKGITYYYYDFLYKSETFETKYEFWLEDNAGNGGERYSFTISIKKPSGRIYYLDQNNNKVYLDNVESINKRNLYFEFENYVQVESGIPFKEGVVYYSYIEGLGYIESCNIRNILCPNFPDGKTGYGNDGNLSSPHFLKNTINYKLGLTNIGSYTEYLSKMNQLYDLANFLVTQELEFTIIDGLTNYSTVYSIEIDIVPPSVNISAPTLTSVANVAGGRLYKGDVIITVDDKARGYLYSSCQLVSGAVACSGQPEVFSGRKVVNATGIYKYHSIDEAGNDTVARDGDYYYFQVDNTTPTIAMNIENKDLGKISLAQGVFTNEAKISATTTDNILTDKIGFEYRVKTASAADFTVWKKEVAQIIYFESEGQYEVRALDFVGNTSKVQSFTIDRTASPVSIKVVDATATLGSRELYNGEIIVSTEKPFFIDWQDKPSVGGDAPIVRVTVNGLLYEKGERISQNGEYNIVAIDLAGNTTTYRVAVNIQEKVCINNMMLEVNAKYMYKLDNITFTGKKDYQFKTTDIILFAIPLYDGNYIGGCDANSSSFMTLDPNSFYEVENQANYFNSNDNVKFNLESKYRQKVIDNGGYVYAFVVSKAIAEVELELPVSKFFLVEDPVGWTIVFVLMMGLFGSFIRIFVIRRRVRVL